MTSEVQDFAITIMLSCTKEELEEVRRYLHKIQWTAQLNDVPDALRESAIYVEDEQRNFVALEK